MRTGAFYILEYDSYIPAVSATNHIFIIFRWQELPNPISVS